MAYFIRKLSEWSDIKFYDQEDYGKGINAVKNQVKQLQDEKKEMKKNHLETQALCHSQQKYIEQLHEDIKAHQDKYVNLSVQLRLSEERIRTLEE